MAENGKVIWRWPKEENLPLSSASSMEIMRLFGGAVEYLIVLLKKAILLYNLESLQENAVHIKGTVVGVLNLNDTFYIIDSRGVFYEIIPGSEFKAQPLPRCASAGETVYVKLFAGGYLRIEKANEECFIYIHWTKNKKEEQLKIPGLESKNIDQSSCVITICKWCELSTELALRLLPIPESEEVEIALISVGNGALYYFHIPESFGIHTDALDKDVQLLVQYEFQSIIGIFCVKDSASDKYTQIAVLQKSGAVQSVSYVGSETELTHTTTYMPCDVHCYAAIGHQTLVLSDSNSLWQSIILLDSNQVVPKHKKFAVRGVRLVATFADEEQVVILTNRGRFYQIALQHLVEAAVDCNALEAEIERSEMRYSELQRQLEARRESVWARSIVARAPALRGTLVITAKVREERVQTQGVAQVDNAPQTFNDHGDYSLDIKLVNNSGVVFTAKLWSLQLTFTQGTGSREIRSIDLLCDFGSQMLKIEQKVQMGDLTHLRIDCRLISRLEDDNTFLMIDTSSLDMDCSYFFKPTEEEGMYEFSSEKKLDALTLLLKLEEEEQSGCRPAETKPHLRRVVYHLKEHVYSVMLPSGLDHRQVWLKLLENNLGSSPSTFVDEMKMKDSKNGLLQLRVLVGIRLVRFKLDNACSKLTIKSHDLPTLRSVKDAALKLLATLGSSRLTKEALLRVKMDREEDLASFQNRHGHLTELENLRDWRTDVTTLLPV